MFFKCLEKQQLKDTYSRKIEFDYLRTFVILLVLFHHAVIAYSTFAFINFENPIATFSPVVNEQRWAGFDLIIAYNDIFFMQLMFFISGLFVFSSLKRKGIKKYLIDRLKRLGIPFIVCVPLIIPLAYYPAQLEVDLLLQSKTSYSDFWLHMIRSGFGTAGPLWFLWVLLVFDFIAALLYYLVPNINRIIKRAALLFERPIIFFTVLLGITILVYLPVLFIFDSQQWIGIGPFGVQASRILLYFVYFLSGTAVGIYGLNHGLLRPYGQLAKRWWLWLTVGLLFFVIFIIAATLETPRPLITGLVSIIARASIILFTIGFFTRYAHRRFAILDNLSHNAYGIYIIHYLFVNWLQYAVLQNELHPFIKGNLVFVGTLVFSWITIAAIRLIPKVRKII